MFAPNPAAVQRRLRVLEMRKSGLTYNTIATACGISPTQVIRDLDRALAEATQAAHLGKCGERKMEQVRIEAALLSLAAKVREGDLPSIDRWLKLCESRRKLMGLDRNPRKTSRQRKQALKTYISLEVDKV